MLNRMIVKRYRTDGKRGRQTMGATQRLGTAFGDVYVADGMCDDCMEKVIGSIRHLLGIQ